MRNNFSLPTLFVAIVCASAAFSSFAQTMEYTQNVLGFQQVTVVSSNLDGLLLGSTPFYQDAAHQVEASLDHVLGTRGGAGETADMADNIFLYDPTNVLSHFTTYWLYFYPGDDEFNWKWISTGGLATNVFVQPGQGFWYLNRSASNLNITLAGNVVDDPVVTNDIVPGIQLLSYPFSKPILMTDMTLTNGVAGETADVADNILLYDSTNVLSHFTTYWLYFYPGDDEFNWKWISTGGLATNVFIQPGQGFWYISRSSTTSQWIEARPYTF